MKKGLLVLAITLLFLGMGKFYAIDLGQYDTLFSKELEGNVLEVNEQDDGYMALIETGSWNYSLNMYDKDFNLKWQYAFDSSEYWDTNYVIDDDGNYLFFGSINENLAALKLDKNGEKFTKELINGFSDIGECKLEKEEKDGYILSCEKTVGVNHFPSMIKLNKKLTAYIADKLNSLYTGVSDVSVVSNKITFEDFAEKYDIPTEVIRDMEEIENGIININGKSFIFADGKLLQIKFNHILNSKTVKFNIDEESDGTQRLVDLLPMLFSMQEDSNFIYFVDEIDRSLHTKLSQFLLEEFVNSINSGYNQIIFTAHDVNLINLDRFRQDEIWFIEKNYRGESRLKPLSNFEINEKRDALKAYLSGRFGAIPTIRGRK